jgi:hypothetical protein
VWSVRSHSRSAVLAAAVVGALGFYTLPTMLYGLAIVAAWVAMHRSDLKWVSVAHWLAGGLAMAILVFVLYLPIVLVSGPERLLTNPAIEQMTWPDLIPELQRSVVETWRFWNRDLPLPVAAVLLIGFMVAMVRRLDGPVPMLGLVLGTCLPLLVAQRVAPFARVWLFLLPLYLLVASAGLVWMGQRLLRGRLPSGIMPTVTMLVAVALGGLTLTSGFTFEAPEFADAEQVARTLASQVRDDDLVLATDTLSQTSLQYYFVRVGLPLEAFSRSPADVRRLFLVAPASESASVVADTMRQKGLRAEDWGPPALNARYAQADLYVLGRRQP